MPKASASVWPKSFGRKARKRFSRHSAEPAMPMASGGGSRRHVVVTRPPEQAGRLSELIRDRGGVAVQFPVLAIEKAESDGDLAAAVQALDSFDIAFL